MIAYKIIAFDEIDSTNDEAKRRIQQGLGENGLVLIASRQTAGRGRQGREWLSPAGNLYASILLKHTGQPSYNSQTAFVVALAVADTIDACCGRAVAQLKWPNDVLVDDRKISGILIEAEGDWLIVGIGLNVKFAPEATNYKTTCLAALGGDVTTDAVRDALLHNLARHWAAYYANGFADIRNAWLARAWRINQPIIVQDNNCETRGIFTGLDENGFCLLETAEGARRIVSGSFMGEAP
jgi:BirA family biotin operon repressor/biotin-[acetyl-CoA-carboxylase] ligase